MSWIWHKLSANHKSLGLFMSCIRRGCVLYLYVGYFITVLMLLRTLIYHSLGVKFVNTAGEPTTTRRNEAATYKVRFCFYKIDF